MSEALHFLHLEKFPWVSGTVLTTWGIIVLLAGLACFSTRKLQDKPNLLQTIIEGIVATIEETIASIVPERSRQIMPFIASLWIFLVIANLTGLIPGLHSPTRDLSATAALAILVFLASHWYGIRCRGMKNYFRHYLMPSPILLPFHIISEITRTFALAVRLFGNIFSLETAALVVVGLAGLLVPIPILMLHIVEALIQAYIFGMLALVYIAGAIQSQQTQ